MIYDCDKFHFVFERVGDFTECPYCGKKTIRESTNEEKRNISGIKRRARKIR